MKKDLTACLSSWLWSEMLGEKYDRTRRMIIPIALRKAEDLPRKIKDIQYRDFSKILATLTRRRNKEFDNAIDTIAADIHKYYKDLKALNQEWNSFKLPPEEEARRSWIKSPISM